MTGAKNAKLRLNWKKIPVILPVIVVVAVLAIGQGHGRTVATVAIAYIAIEVITLAIVLLTAYIYAKSNDTPPFPLNIIGMMMCGIWVVGMSVWYLNFGHVVRLLTPGKRRRVITLVRGRARRWFR